MLNEFLQFLLFMIIFRKLEVFFRGKSDYRFKRVFLFTLKELEKVQIFGKFKGY